MSFIESPRFPTNISFGSSGGPRYDTTIVVVSSGFEYTNINWDNARHEYNAALGVRTQNELSELIKFFRNTRGRGHTFRYKDWADYKSCDAEAIATHNDQIIGAGDTIETQFQLVKLYDISGGVPNTRTINKPVSGTISIGLDGVLQSSGYSIDYTTGIVTFTSPPGSGVVITWGGEFDVPCRFDTDKLDIVLDMYEHGTTSVPIIEVRV